MENINKYYFDWKNAKKILAFTLILFLILLYFLQDNMVMFINLLLSYIIILGLIFDSRININRKLLIIFLMFILWIISVYINKIPYLIIKDLFWYSVILNISFIFHVLILSWIYRICWLNRWEYSCYIISRISFTLSLSFIIYILRRFSLKFYFKDKLIFKIGYYFLMVLLLILRYFVNTFHKYVVFIMGLNKKNNQSLVEELIDKSKILEFILFTLSLSIIIGYSRLYLIWAIYFSNNLLKIYYNHYLNLKNNKINNLKDYFLNIFWKIEIKEKTGIYLYKFNDLEQYKDLKLYYEKPYYDLFVFDLVKFITIDGEYDCCHDIPELEEGEFPIKTPFKYYPWLYMMQEYYKLSDITQDYYDCTLPSNKYYWETIEKRYNKLMQMCEDINLNPSKYNLISEELPKELDPEIVKNQSNFYLDLETNKFKLKI